jgi:hypothetical protein
MGDFHLDQLWPTQGDYTTDPTLCSHVYFTQNRAYLHGLDAQKNTRFPGQMAVSLSRATLRRLRGQTLTHRVYKLPEILSWTHEAAPTPFPDALLVLKPAVSNSDLVTRSVPVSTTVTSQQRDSQQRDYRQCDTQQHSQKCVPLPCTELLDFGVKPMYFEWVLIDKQSRPNLDFGVEPRGFIFGV